MKRTGGGGSWNQTVNNAATTRNHRRHGGRRMRRLRCAPVTVFRGQSVCFTTTTPDLYIKVVHSWSPKITEEGEKRGFLDLSLDYSYSLDNNTYKLARISLGGRREGGKGYRLNAIQYWGEKYMGNEQLIQHVISCRNMSVTYREPTRHIMSNSSAWRIGCSPTTPPSDTQRAGQTTFAEVMARLQVEVTMI